MMRSFRGIYSAMVTPLDEQATLDLESVERLLVHLKGHGCHGVLLSGTTGEGPSLSSQERIRLFQKARQVDSGLILLAGTGAASLEETITLTRASFDLGLDAAVIIPPFFYSDPPLHGLVEFFREVIRRAVPSDGSILLYHNPFVLAVEVSHELIARLRDQYPNNVVGMKDSSRNVERVKSLIDRFPGFEVLVGDDRSLAEVLAHGGAGAITAVANLFPDMLAEVFDSSGSHETGAQAQPRLTKAADMLSGLPTVPAIKSLLNTARILSSDTVIPPLHRLGAAEYLLLAERFHLNVKAPASSETDFGDKFLTG